ncbi:hypothetical protein CRG98_010658 [Punica granatum]|uniref:Uncharacterized protein n=1 Tax=Punica granatum TaxID=22663 RepID=A0A2I0KKE8_PUNGR|nr:hypothetical protein CRG98_010658 [Punica granatum]
MEFGQRGGCPWATRGSHGPRGKTERKFGSQLVVRSKPVGQLRLPMFHQTILRLCIPNESEPKWGADSLERVKGEVLIVPDADVRNGRLLINRVVLFTVDSDELVFDVELELLMQRGRDDAGRMDPQPPEQQAECIWDVENLEVQIHVHLFEGGDRAHIESRDDVVHDPADDEVIACADDVQRPRVLTPLGGKFVVQERYIAREDRAHGLLDSIWSHLLRDHFRGGFEHSSGGLSLVRGLQVLLHPARPCHAHDTQLLLEVANATLVCPGDPTISVRFPSGNIDRERCRRGTRPRESNYGFRWDVLNYEWDRSLLPVLVLSNGTNADYVNGGSRARPMIRERVDLHVRLLNGIEQELMLLNHLLDLPPQPPAVVNGMVGTTQVKFTALALVLRCWVEVLARRLRHDLATSEELPVWGPLRRLRNSLSRGSVLLCLRRSKGITMDNLLQGRR